MKNSGAHSEGSNDTGGFAAALDAGALDACLELMRGGDIDPDPAALCRLAEALQHRDRPAEAAECCRRVLRLAQDDSDLLRLCAWVFSNAGWHEEAVAVYLRLLELCPDWLEGHRHASGSLAAIGRLDEAIAHAMAACAAAPDNVEFAQHAGTLLNAALRHPEAAAVLERAIRLGTDDPRTLIQLALAEQGLGRGAEAAALARRAADLAGGEAAIVVDAAEVLLRCGQAAEAADILSRAAGAGADPRLWRVLSGAEMLCDRPAAALAAIDRAIAAAPDNAEYELHRAHLLWQLDDPSGAARSLERAAALGPESRDLRRAQMGFYLAHGLASEATAAGGELLQRFPDDRPSAEAVLHLLEHRLGAIDGDYVVLSDGSRRPARPPRPPAGRAERLRRQRRVIRALIIRETRTRFAEFRLGYGWALLEPILHIALLSATFAVLMHGNPPIGRHFFVFYYTGLIPYHVFVHSSSGMSHAVTGNAPLLQLPPVTSFDVIAARGLLEVATDIVVAVVILAGFGAVGVAALPDDLWEPSVALLVTAALGCGLGFVNAVLTVFWRSWEKAYGQLTRVLYFISGIFYVPGMMPDWARDALAWNPLLHAIDWFRAGFFASYRPHWLDRPYLVVLAILSLLIGLSLQRGLRRRLSVPL